MLSLPPRLLSSCSVRKWMAFPRKSTWKVNILGCMGIARFSKIYRVRNHISALFSVSGISQRNTRSFSWASAGLKIVLLSLGPYSLPTHAGYRENERGRSASLCIYIRCTSEPSPKLGGIQGRTRENYVRGELHSVSSRWKGVTRGRPACVLQITREKLMVIWYCIVYRN